MSLFLLLAASPATPLDVETLRQRLIQGDLISIERARWIHADRGVPIDRGSLGLLDDLSRFARCLPLGPFPKDETAHIRAARTAVRLERVRLERRKLDGAYRGTSLDQLFGGKLALRHEGLTKTSLFVRWPVEEETWPGETADPSIEPPACSVAGTKPDPAHASIREKAERGWLWALFEQRDALPAETRAAAAFAVVASLDSTLVLQHQNELARALSEGSAPYRSAGLSALARQLQLAGELQAALQLYRAVIADPAATADEDSRARAHAASLLEPDWQAVIDLAVTARAPRPSDRAALANAEARARFALGDLDGLGAFARGWLASRGEADAAGFDLATEELLLRAALSREVPAALAWIEALPIGERAAKLDRAAKLAVDAERLDLAIAIYDRLRIEAAASLARRGPAASSDLARWTADRALLEYETGDSAAFAGLIEELVKAAQEDAGRPLARTAPHRQVARVAQTLLGRITNDVAAVPERRKYAAVLVAAIDPLVKEATRWRTVLLDLRPPLALLAGGATAPEPAAAPEKPRPKVRSLGEVVIPRLPPRIEVIDQPTPLPVIDSFLVHENSDGRLVAGPPWIKSSAPSRSKPR